MKTSFNSLSLSILFYFFIGIAIPTMAQTYNLTGTWIDNNSTTYFLRQVGDKLFWSMDAKPNVHNVFYGTISRNKINGEWADLPDGQKSGNGTLVLNIESNDRFTKSNQTGNYGARIWTRSGSSVYPSLVGVWYAFFPKYGIENEQCQITQGGRELIFINEKGARSKGSFENETTVIAEEWGSLKGTLSNKVTIPGTISGEYTKIDWSNGSYWVKYIE